jgi:phenylacetate-coenzyme A ligase PaaK-like adenylate-forming protein
MPLLTSPLNEIFSVRKDSFDLLAIEIFQYQAAHNPVYREYLGYLDINALEVRKVSEIPFLPIELFKNHKILSGSAEAEMIFESSGTTGSIPSRHYIADLKIYQKSIEQGFRQFFGDPTDYVFLALLPSYLERNNSSLVYMVQYLMNLSNHEENGFYLYEHDKLNEAIKRLSVSNKKIFFIGVSFALLDFAENYHPDLSNAIIMETGGMKGQRKELTRPELHDTLKNAFHSNTIMSEYGMAELLSQAYSKKDGYFETPAWMKFLVRDVNDPFSYIEEGQTGGLNVIDLANVNSCSFIATQDLVRIMEDSRIEILGRFDNSDIRGCSLMYQ